jgi:tRNA G18 (ribose-2'-O)-methylase SpoU
VFMRVIRIETLEDPRVDDYRSVPDPDLLRRRGLFVAEGRLVVERLLESRHRVRSLLLNQAAFASLSGRLDRLADTPVYVGSAEVLASIVGFKLHRGCLALAERPGDQDPDAIVRHARLVLVLEGITDADNVGGAFRNAAAFGVDGILLSPTCCDPLYRKAIRTSVASALQVPYARVARWPAELAALKTKGFMLVALTPRHPAIDLSSCRPQRAGQRVALLVGSEGPGLSFESESLADLRVRISMQPGIDSLNLATATGIALHYLSGLDRRSPVAAGR